MKKIIYIMMVIIFLISCNEQQDFAPKEGPPAFPFVFQGLAYVDGKPIRADVTIFAKLGDSRSLTALTKSGEYWNIIISPKNQKEANQSVTFHIGKPSSDTIQADEKFKMKNLSEPAQVTLNLHFRKYP